MVNSHLWQINLEFTYTVVGQRRGRSWPEDDSMLTVDIERSEYSCGKLMKPFAAQYEVDGIASYWFQYTRVSEQYCIFIIIYILFLNSHLCTVTCHLFCLEYLWLPEKQHLTERLLCLSLWDWSDWFNSNSQPCKCVSFPWLDRDHCFSRLKRMVHLSTHGYESHLRRQIFYLDVLM